MIRALPIAFAIVLPACAGPSMNEPSLAKRAAEDIDPRVPIPSDVPEGTADVQLAEALDALVAKARSGQSEFGRRAAEATTLASTAGPQASESWIAAQQALSRLIEQQGVTATAAADIDAIASSRLQSNGWVSPADQKQIQRAQGEVAAIASVQLDLIDRVRSQIAR